MKQYTYEKEHIETLRRLVPECMVLLKSDGSFPLGRPCNIALYGSGARRTVKGGTGSGDVNVRHTVTIEEGLEHAGFTITTKEWLDGYEREWEKARPKFVEGIKAQAKAAGVPAIALGMGAVMPEPEYTLPLEGAGDVALYVLSRISGEGSDRRPLEGDFKLTRTEVRDILALAKKHRYFMLILNVGGVVELTPVLEIKNILLLSQVGMTIGDSLADVLLGKSYPSGKLTSTWAAWENYCRAGDFGEQDDTRYREGIYVGYRYFDTVNQTPLFPFGYGLGYTDFSISDPAVSLKGTGVIVTARVENTGSLPGKEVVQLYVSVPGGKLNQPYQTLAAFTKTDELQAGETKRVTIQFSMEELASFDEERAASVLEPGDYILRIGSSSRSTHVCGVVRQEGEFIVRQLTHAGITPNLGMPDFPDWQPAGQPWSYPEEEAEIEKAPVFCLQAEVFTRQPEPAVRDADPGLDGLFDKLSDSELIFLCIGDYRSGNESTSVIGNAGITVAGAAGETSSRLKQAGIPSLIMADGPAGLRLSRHYGVDEQGVYTVKSDNSAAVPDMDFIDEETLKMLGIKKDDTTGRNGKIYDQYCSAIPIGTALAQSFHPALCQRCGDLVGDEMERFGIHLWLAPALNIHRSPLCGRNFEYFSEDPLLSGKIAAAITRGVQAHPGCGVTIKHFACNNQETNRFRSNSIVSERALREIYLRGFEICIKETMPAALMTSYNLLNGVHTSERWDIINGILRGEWGFDGIVMSDWLVGSVQLGERKYPKATAAKSIKAGNDLIMPGSEADYNDVLTALEGSNPDVSLTHEEIRACARRILKMAVQLTRARP